MAAILQFGIHFFNQNCILIQVKFKMISIGSSKNKTVLIKIITWPWTADKTLSEAILVNFMVKFIVAYMWHSVSMS